MMLITGTIYEIITHPLTRQGQTRKTKQDKYSKQRDPKAVASKSGKGQYIYGLITHHLTRQGQTRKTKYDRYSKIERQKAVSSKSGKGTEATEIITHPLTRQDQTRKTKQYKYSEQRVKKQCRANQVKEQRRLRAIYSRVTLERPNRINRGTTNCGEQI